MLDLHVVQWNPLYNGHFWGAMFRPLFIVEGLFCTRTTVETGLLAHALMGSIAELYALIFRMRL